MNLRTIVAGCLSHTIVYLPILKRTGDQVLVPVKATPVRRLTPPGPYRWKLWDAERSRMTKVLFPRLAFLTTVPFARLSTMVVPGPTVP